MIKKYFSWMVIAIVFTAVILMSNFNASAYKGSESAAGAFNTDKTDRTLLKEIVVNQQKTHALLREIKMSLSAK